jgi:hypothetical protein
MAFLPSDTVLVLLRLGGNLQHKLADVLVPGLHNALYNLL